MSKTCPRCKVTKPSERFHKDNWYKDGLGTYCMECERERRKNQGQTESGRLSIKLKSKRMREKYPEKYKARQMVHRAVNNGTIVKPSVCENCDRIVPLQAHHEDYSKPLDVNWLCDPCHKLSHGKLRDMSLITSPKPQSKSNKGEVDE